MEKPKRTDDHTASTLEPASNRPSKSARRYNAPALEKGLDILELLSTAEVGLTLQKVAIALGRTKSEIFRMMSVLEARGYIERGAPDELYRLSEKMFRLSLTRPPFRSLIAVAMPLMTEFADRNGYSCHLAVRSADQIVVVARIESTTHIGFSTRIGYRQPLEITGSGHCLLAFMNTRRREAAMKAIAAERPQTDLAALSADLDETRRSGRVIRPSGVTQGVIDLSVPIIDPGECGAVAALTCPYLPLRVDPIAPELLCDRLLETANRIAWKAFST